mmetsp:Transcript_56583/g.88052  ORF Transcript_56583/g.88052 Transcript_56583/m.88052 type:complete len:271 (-) Transcript_56583:55-867(-)
MDSSNLSMVPVMGNSNLSKVGEVYETQTDKPRSDAVTLISRQRVKRDSFAHFEQWLRQMTEACHSYSPTGHLTSTIVRPVAGDNEFITIARFASLEARQAWEKSSVREEMLGKRKAMLEDEADIITFGEHTRMLQDLEEGDCGSNTWEVFAEALERNRSSPKTGAPPKHGPPCKYRLLCIVWLSALATAVVLQYTIVPLYKDRLMHAVGEEWFTPIFTMCMISGVMPIVFLILVPLITTFVVPKWVRVRPARGACGKGRIGSCCFWFWVG